MPRNMIPTAIKTAARLREPARDCPGVPLHDRYSGRAFHVSSSERANLRLENLEAARMKTANSAAFSGDAVSSTVSPNDSTHSYSSEPPVAVRGKGRSLSA